MKFLFVSVSKTRGKNLIKLKHQYTEIMREGSLSVDFPLCSSQMKYIYIGLYFGVSQCELE
jgi:hypothetical protein